MAAIPTAGGASYALRWVMRALLRVVVLVGLLTIGWLLGAGTSHADDDPGLPETGLVHLAKAVSFGEPSSGRVGVHPLLSPAITRALPAVSVPSLPVQSPVQLGVLRPIVKAVGLPKPSVLAPVSRSLPGTAPHIGEIRTPAPVEPLLVMPTAPPAVAAAVPPAAVHTAVLTLAPAHRPALPVTRCAPAEAVVDPLVDPVIVQPATGHEVPSGPAPMNPPGSNASACLLSSAGAGGGTKGSPDLAAQLSSAMTDRAQPPDGSASQDSSDLPRSLSAQPSTSPD